MTLKQFFQLAGGFLVSLIFYSTPIIGIVKWPIVILSALLGAALAFVPLEERPLERWIYAFFRAIYSPTLFYWKKTATPIKFYQDETGAAETPAGPQEQALKAYFSSTPKTGEINKLEGEELGFLAKLTGVVSGLVTQATGGPIVTNDQMAKSTNMPMQTATPQIPKPAPAKDIQIPQTMPIRVERQAPHLVVEENKSPTPGSLTQEVSPVLAGEEIVSTKQAIFSVDAAPPNPPSMPNVVVGQVVDADRKIVEGAIMEIRDANGRPVRALRSNKVGHFVTVTPLEPGRYDIATDKEGYEFVPVSFEAGGQLIPPILVQGRKIVQNVPVPMGTAPQQQMQTNYQ